MTTGTHEQHGPRDAAPKRGIGRPLLAGLFAVLAVAVMAAVLAGNLALRDRFTELQRSQAEVDLALHNAGILTELQRNAVVPLLLAQDPVLISALASEDYSRSSARLLSLLDEVGAAGFLMLDATGRTVAATDRNQLGRSHADAPYFQQALQGDVPETTFTSHRGADGAMVFAYARRVAVGGGADGVVVVLVDLARFERRWARFGERILVTDRMGTVLLASQPVWRGRPEAEALALLPPEAEVMPPAQVGPGASVRTEDRAGVEGAVLRTDGRINFNAWRIASFTSLQPVRDRMQGVIALQAVLAALLVAAGFYAKTRREKARSDQLRRDAAALRELNAQLERAIAERKVAQENLEVAEQTLEQSSKLAALGEMSAAVSHELNQPLAAMKTYLAGARLLWQRGCETEAEDSLKRIDDLIERMGALTRQLKSHARRGGNDVGPVDLCKALRAALDLMAPQVRAEKVSLTSKTPDQPVLVIGNQLRLEQVLINLLRNALDATRGLAQPSISVHLVLGETATVSVRDNGHGIADLEALFEPFYTTKAPGDGTGLGLAIASGIVAEFGGTLTARNGAQGGAVFEMQLPLATPDQLDAARTQMRSAAAGVAP